MVRKLLALVMSTLILAGCANFSGGLGGVNGSFDQENSICVTWTNPDKLACDLTYTLTNTTDSPITISGANVFVEADGQTFQAVAEDQLDSSVYNVSVTLNPGETRFARTGFQIPVGATISHLWLGVGSRIDVDISVGVSTSQLSR
jgi:hypothetical protein